MSVSSFGTLGLLPFRILLLSVSLFFWDLKYKCDGRPQPSLLFFPVLLLLTLQCRYCLLTLSEFTSPVLCSAEFSAKPSLHQRPFSRTLLHSLHPFLSLFLSVLTR